MSDALWDTTVFIDWWDGLPEAVALVLTLDKSAVIPNCCQGRWQVAFGIRVL